MEKINIGIIGNGKSCHRYHLPYIEQSNLFNVVGIYSRTEKTFEMPYPKEYKHVHDIAEFFALDMPVVAITTPHDTHYELAKMCIENKKHVIIEKPLCKKVDELKELYELAKKHNVVIMPFQNRRFDNDFLTVKPIISTKDYGEIIEIESNHTYYRPNDIVETTDIYSGFIYGHAVHFIDQIISVFGKPDKVIKDSENQRLYFTKHSMEKAAEDMYDLKFIYGKTHIRVRFSPMCHYELPSWIIHTTEYSFVKMRRDAQEIDLKQGRYPFDENFGVDNDYVMVCRNNELISDVVIDNVFKTHVSYYENVYDVIKKGKNPVVSEEEAVLLLDIMQKLVEEKWL